jgi:hypothetical protein
MKEAVRLYPWACLAKHAEGCTSLELMLAEGQESKISLISDP